VDAELALGFLVRSKHHSLFADEAIGGEARLVLIDALASTNCSFFAFAMRYARR
jgi:hypothetical protein